MDTVFTLRIYGESEENSTHFSAVHMLLRDIENALSKTRSSSDVSRINRERSAGSLSPHTQAVLQIASEATALTEGAYLPTMGAVSELWSRAEETGVLPDAEALDIALADARLGFVLEDGVCTLPGAGALLDLGGIGKGYAADCVLDYLREQGVRGALLSFGSSVATIGEKGNGKPFEIGLRHPRNGSASVGTFTDPMGVLSVSGDYERYVTVQGKRYHHVLDPQSGYPSNAGIASVAVLCENGALSDALSTAFLVLGRDRALQLLQDKQINAQVVFVTADGECSANTDVFTVN